MIKKIKAILATGLIVGCVASVPFITSASAIHGADVNRFGPYAAGYAWTEWENVNHMTVMKIGITQASRSGVSYTQTPVIQGIGNATSWYDRIN
ncbi:UNVERIFIED_CONTAM: hypothetical protein Cloal_2384 [Acetivibrio alkalicellulosi]